MQKKVKQICKKYKIDPNITRETFATVCSLLNYRVSQLNAIEAMLYCRGSDNSEEFSLSKMCLFMVHNVKKALPYQNAMNKSTASGFNRNTYAEGPNDYGTLPAGHQSLPTLKKQNSTARVALKSQAHVRGHLASGYDSSYDFRITQMHTQGSPNIHKPNPNLHSSLSDFRRHQMSRAESRSSMEHDLNFQSQVRNCISSLDKMPKLKEKIVEKLQIMDQSYAEQEGRKG